MSNRIVKHSPRYSGPAGDSRPAAEIFDSMEKRAKQSQEAIKELRVCLDDTLAKMTLSSHDGAVDAIKNAFIEWWSENDIELKERLGSE